MGHHVPGHTCRTSEESKARASFIASVVAESFCNIARRVVSEVSVLNLFCSECVNRWGVRHVCNRLIFPIPVSCSIVVVELKNAAVYVVLYYRVIIII